MGVEVSPGTVIAQLNEKRELEFVHRKGGVGDVRAAENCSDTHFIAEDSEAWDSHETRRVTARDRTKNLAFLAPSPASIVFKNYKNGDQGVRSDTGG